MYCFFLCCLFPFSLQVFGEKQKNKTDGKIDHSTVYIWVVLSTHHWNWHHLVHAIFWRRLSVDLQEVHRNTVDRWRPCIPSLPRWWLSGTCRRRSSWWSSSCWWGARACGTDRRPPARSWTWWTLGSCRCRSWRAHARGTAPQRRAGRSRGRGWRHFVFWCRTPAWCWLWASSPAVAGERRNQARGNWYCSTSHTSCRQNLQCTKVKDGILANLDLLLICW